MSKMTDTEKVKILKEILSKQLDWYRQCLIDEADEVIDSSYIYDEASEQFNDLRRGDYQNILEILND